MTARVDLGAPARMRLAPQPGEVIDRSRTLTFSWNGRAFPAHPGDTIVSALAAAGERVFSRSFKYHRPRGLLTASYHDPGTILQVDDEPNVRAAHRLVAQGIQVSSQNTWPSLRYDVKSVNQLVGRFLAPGFYYKTFIKPERLWPAYEKVLARFAHAGEVSPDTPHAQFDKRHAHPDVLVAGGGPAGITAALAAARAGARVLLVEEEHQLGGHLRWGGAAELATLAELRAAVAAAPGVEVLTDSAVLARYDDNWVAVVARGRGPGAAERLVKARAGTLVVAPGLIERPYVFESPPAECRRLWADRSAWPSTDAPVSPVRDTGSPISRSPVVLTAPAPATSPVPAAPVPATALPLAPANRGGSGQAVTLADLSLLAKVAVRAPYGGTVAGALGTRFRRTVRDAHGALVVGSGPGEWLVLAAPGTQDVLRDRLSQLVAPPGEFASVIDLTHGRALLRLSSDRSADLLAPGRCSAGCRRRVRPTGGW